MMRIKNSYNLLPDEEPSHLAVKSKCHVTKFSFLTAMTQKIERFGNKIEIWPIPLK